SASGPPEPEPAVAAALEPVADPPRPRTPQRAPAGGRGLRDLHRRPGHGERPPPWRLATRGAAPAGARGPAPHIRRPHRVPPPPRRLHGVPRRLRVPRMARAAGR